MDTNISMVQGDASPSKVFQFVREDGTVPDLTDYQSATFDIIRPDSGDQTNPDSDTCEILSPGSNGWVQYDWSVGDLPVSGLYRCLLQIVDQNGKPETNIVYIDVESNTD